MFKCKILWKVAPDKLEWQNKSFADKMKALEFCRIHSDKVFGVNDVTFPYVPACLSINGEFIVEHVNHFQIIQALGGI